MRILVIVVSTLTMLILTPNLRAHYKPGEHNVTHAIRLNWCGKANPWCPHAREALAVAQCESGLNWLARSPGGHWGLFQHGEYARARYGFRWNPWFQARVAYRYWRDSGRDWSPWTCKP